MDPLIGHFKNPEKIFQLHGDTFDIPKSAVHLARSEICEGQAFRYGNKAYGIQFHLEVDQSMIDRWFTIPENLEELKRSGGKFTEEQMRADTKKYLDHSQDISRKTFRHFMEIFGVSKKVLSPSGHGKPLKG